MVLALQEQLTEEPGVHLRDTEVGKYAIKMRKVRKQELTYLSRKEDIEELQSVLDIGALDSQKLDVKIHEKVKEYIGEVIKEEMKKFSRKPTALNIITWTLSAIGTILGALVGTGVIS